MRGAYDDLGAYGSTPPLPQSGSQLPTRSNNEACLYQYLSISISISQLIRLKTGPVQPTPIKPHAPQAKRGNKGGNKGISKCKCQCQQGSQEARLHQPLILRERGGEAKRLQIESRLSFYQDGWMDGQMYRAEEDCV